jgi:hypothetical protein
MNAEHKKRQKLHIAKNVICKYNSTTTIGEGGNEMSAMIAEKIRKLNLTEDQKRNLKIDNIDFEKKIDSDFVNKVMISIEKYKNTINELAKH